MAEPKKGAPIPATVETEFPGVVETDFRRPVADEPEPKTPAETIREAAEALVADGPVIVPRSEQIARVVQVQTAEYPGTAWLHFWPDGKVTWK